MITITDILQDVDRGILANNMVEDKFLLITVSNDCLNLLYGVPM